MLESIPDVVHARGFAVRDQDLDHIEAPRQLAGAQTFEPCVGPAFDQALFLFIHGIERPDFRGFVAGFHLDEQQELALAGDDVHLSAAGAFEIPPEDPASAGSQEIGGDILTIPAEPVAVAGIAIRPGQTAG